MVETGPQSKIELEIPREFDHATREALDEIVGVKFYDLGKSTDEILADRRVDMDRDSDDFIKSPRFNLRRPVYSEVGVLPEPIRAGGRTLGFDGLEEEMHRLEMSIKSYLKPEEAGFFLRTGDLADMLDVMDQLHREPGNPNATTWTNTRVYKDAFLNIDTRGIQIGHDARWTIRTIRAPHYSSDLIPLIVPAKIYTSQ
jgi:hypothetical protein